MRHLLVSLVLFGILCATPKLFAKDINEGFDNPALDNVWSLTANPAINYAFTERKGFMSVTIPGDRPYDIWSNDVNDGLLMLRHDQGNGDWAVETLMEIRSSGHAYQTGLVVWSNPYVMYFWGVKCQKEKNRLYYSGEQLGISDLNTNLKDSEVEDEWVTLRIEKFGKKFLLQYWDENEESFVTYETIHFKFPVNGVGLMARTFSANGADLHLSIDYIKVIK